MIHQLDFTPPQAPPACNVDLAAEANHRIANNLNALAVLLREQIAAAQAEDEKVPRERMVAALTDVTGNVLAISRLHQRLATRHSGDVDLHAVLVDILQAFEASGICGDRLHIVSTRSASCRVDAARASTLALAFSEIVTNAIKYAHPTGIPVELAVSTVPLLDGSIELLITDDGVGFPEGFVEERDAGLGLRLVRSLVESVGGRLDIRSDPLGLVFSIHLAPASK
jgi:two-component sensor histidine kinase